MNRIGYTGLLLSISLFSLKIYSQDKIYLSTSTKQGKVIEITDTYISYRPTLEKSQVINLPSRNVVLLFNEKGGYLMPSKMNINEEHSKQAINAFLKQDISYWTDDRVFETDKKMTEGKITEEDNNEVKITSKTSLIKIPKKSIAIIIYKDGRHVIHGSLSATAEMLSFHQGSFAGVSSMQVNSTVSTKEPVAAKEAAASAQIVTAGENPPPLVIDDLISNVSKKEFEEKAMQKTRMFSNYLKILCDKSNPENELNKAVDLAVGLFVNENAVIESSSVNRSNIKRNKIRAYLTTLKLVRYDRIELEWTNVQYVNDLKLAPDGTYRGVVTFEQTFSGFRDGALVYKDITKKSAEVILKSYNKVVEGQQVSNWDILLGDVGVSWTQKPTAP